MTTDPTPQNPQLPEIPQLQEIPGQLSIYDALPEAPPPSTSPISTALSRPTVPRRIHPAPSGRHPQTRLPRLSLPTPTTTLHLLDLRSWAGAHLPSEAVLTRAGHSAGPPVEACCPTCGYRDDPWRLRIYHLAPCQTPPAPRSRAH